MGIRFEDVSDSVVRLADEIQEDYFPELVNVKIKFLFDLKKRMSNGKVVLGRCQKTTDVVKYFTIGESGGDEGYHYIIYLDKCAWDNIERTDQIRLIRHEMRHIEYDIDAKNPYKIQPHDIEDFAEEIELNIDDTRWASRVASLAEEIYSQRRDQEADEEE